MTSPQTVQAMIEAVGRSLGPPSRVVGETLSWTAGERLAAYDCPAASLAVMEDGEVLWAHAFGLADRESGRAADAETLFSGASISKPLTAALTLQAVEAGRLDLDVDVNRYLSRWRLEDNAYTRVEPVTLRRLLSHRAGTTVHGFGGAPPDRALPTLEDILSGRPPAVNGPVFVDKVPGASERYSGGGTMIVQLVLEEVSGLPFAELAKTALFDPLGMTRTTFRNPLDQSLRDGAAKGYEGGRPIPGDYVCVPQLAAGGVWTTPTDFARFMNACRAAWLGRETPLFGAALARDMMRSQGGVFGLGWEVMGAGPAARFSHGGSNDGYQCEAMALLESGRGAVVMTNADSGLLLYWEFFAAVAQAHGWTDFMPPPRRVRPFTPETLSKLEGVYDIVSGVEMPDLRAWSENGVLLTQIAGMRGGPSPTLMDENGRLFNRVRPSETEVIYGEDGVAEELRVLMFGQAEILRLRRRR